MNRFLPCSLLFFAACGGTSTSADVDASADASADATSDHATPDAAADASADSSDGGACNTLANIAPVVAMDFVASPPPVARGGTIADGTYVMSSAGFYTGTGGVSGPSGITGQVTIRVHGTTVDVATKGTPDHLTTTLVTNGTNLERTDTCPDSTTQSGQFTATPTSLVVMLPAGTFPDGGSKTLVETFDKQ